MSCWVVPMLAAEFWRIPLEQVMDKIQRNAVPIRREEGFTFVDILPDPGPALGKGGERPRTYEVAPGVAVVPVAMWRAAEGNGDCVSRNPVRRQTAALRRSPAGLV